jgi:saccharopine dehydrogenase (NAD+, L-lysine forming)
LNSTILDRLAVTTTKALLDADFHVHVERRPARTFDDSEFKAVGASLVPEYTWVDAPYHHVIVGLKELPEASSP